MVFGVGNFELGKGRMKGVVGFKANHSALLAHSVEHFHGKEEVAGSIPAEGS